MSENTVQMLGPFDVPGLSSRRVRVYVPRKHEAAGRHGSGRMPVLYLFDGQNLFDDKPSFAGGWHLHTAVDRIGQKRRVPIIVGIDHGGVSRIDELGPWRTERGGGKTDALLDWVVGTLMPRIQRDFHVESEPEHVGIGGSSLGGLAAMYAHHRHPDRFGNVLSMSPSLWFSRGRILEFVGATSKPWRSRIYVDAGAKEGAGLAAMCGRMADLMRERGYGADAFRYRFDKKGSHNEMHWRRRAPNAIRFLFPWAASSGRIAA